MKSNIIDLERNITVEQALEKKSMFFIRHFERLDESEDDLLIYYFIFGNYELTFVNREVILDRKCCITVAHLFIIL